jgi:hypothetical protein
MGRDDMRIMYGAPPAPEKKRLLKSEVMALASLVDPPPPEAASAELKAAAVLEALDAAARKRILRCALSKWGKP